MKARVSLNRQNFQDLIRGKTITVDGYVDSHVERINVELGLQDIGYEIMLDDLDAAYIETLKAASPKKQ